MYPIPLDHRIASRTDKVEADFPVRWCPACDADIAEYHKECPKCQGYGLCPEDKVAYKMDYIRADLSAAAHSLGNAKPTRQCPKCKARPDIEAVKDDIVSSIEAIKDKIYKRAAGMAATPGGNLIPGVSPAPVMKANGLGATHVIDWDTIQPGTILKSPVRLVEYDSPNSVGFDGVGLTAPAGHPVGSTKWWLQNGRFRLATPAEIEEHQEAIDKYGKHQKPKETCDVKVGDWHVNEYGVGRKVESVDSLITYSTYGTKGANHVGAASLGFIEGSLRNTDNLKPGDVVRDKGTGNVYKVLKYQHDIRSWTVTAIAGTEASGGMSDHYLANDYAELLIPVELTKVGWYYDKVGKKMRWKHPELL